MQGKSISSRNHSVIFPTSLFFMDAQKWLPGCTVLLSDTCVVAGLMPSLGFFQNEPGEERVFVEDVFKKPLPPSVKKDESTGLVRCYTCLPWSSMSNS